MAPGSSEADSRQAGPDAEPDPPDSRRELSDVRGELQRLGYLDHQVERFLLQDALRPEQAWQALWHLAIKVGLLIGVPSAVIVSLGLAGVNGHLVRSPFDVLPLFLHLLFPLVVGPGLGFLALASLLMVLLRVWHVRRIEATSFGLAVSSAVLAVVLALVQGRGLADALPRWQSVGLVVLAPLLAFALFKVVHGGLLTLAIRLTDLAPEQPFGHGRLWIAGLSVATFLVTLPIAFGAGRAAPEEPAILPTSAAGRTLVIGVDGVLAEEVDYLLEGRELPHWARLVGDLAPEAGGAGGNDGGQSAPDSASPSAPGPEGAGVVFEYSRGEEAPIAFWATLATGLPSPRHGMASIDTFRPRGMSRSLERSGWLRLYWRALAAVGLATYEPVLANDRRAWSFWELATRGGAPGLVVGWWGTFPVEPIPGTLIGHGAYQLLESEPEAPMIHPPEERPRFAEMARTAPDLPAPMARALALALGSEAAGRVREKALRPDIFYARAFTDGLASTPGLAALYLPGLDIAADKARLGSLALADLVRWQLGRVDALLANLPDDVDTVLIVLDPGRRRSAGGGPGPAASGSALPDSGAGRVAGGSREGTEGRALLWRRGGQCAETRARTRPEALTAAVLRGLGLPQSDELPEPPTVCAWPEPSMRVATYGERRPSSAQVEGDEYLRSLQALGYL